MTPKRLRASAGRTRTDEAARSLRAERESTMSVMIKCTARLARALGHPGPLRRGWADHHHIPMEVPSELVDTLDEREVYEWRTETSSIVFDASDERCAELHAAFRARQLGVEAAHVSDLDAETSSSTAHTHTRYGEYVVTDLVEERDEVVPVAVAWGSATEAFEAGC